MEPTVLGVQLLPLQEDRELQCVAISMCKVLSGVSVKVLEPVLKVLVGISFL